jgi:hypothetical protein
LHALPVPSTESCCIPTLQRPPALLQRYNIYLLWRKLFLVKVILPFINLRELWCPWKPWQRCNHGNHGNHGVHGTRYLSRRRYIRIKQSRWQFKRSTRCWCTLASSHRTHLSVLLSKVGGNVKRGRFVTCISFDLYCCCFALPCRLYLYTTACASSMRTLHAHATRARGM